MLAILRHGAISCTDPALGYLDVSYTGLDLATGGTPTVSLEDPSGSLTTTGVDADTDSPPEPGVQVLAIITAAVTAAGLGTIAIGSARLRMAVTGAIAAVAGVLLSITELVALANLDSEIRARVRIQFPTFDLDVVHPRIGFWLSLTALALVMVVNIAVAVRSWVRQ